MSLGMLERVKHTFLMTFSLT